MEAHTKRKQFCILLVIELALCRYLPLASSQTDTQHSEAIKDCVIRLGSQLPPDAIVQCHLRDHASGDIVGYGIDTVTGAWYIARSNGFAGIEASGDEFKQLASPNDPLATRSLSQFGNHVKRIVFSSYRVRQFVFEADSITYCSAGPDGTYELKMVVPDERRDLGLEGLEYSIKLNAACAITHSQRTGQTAPDEYAQVGFAARIYPVSAIAQDANKYEVVWSSASLRTAEQPAPSMRTLARAAYEVAKKQSPPPPPAPTTTQAESDQIRQSHEVSSQTRWLSRSFVAIGVIVVITGFALWWKNR
jgi:hypothetical protein